MKYIRSCENCYREIRFPIDKGTLFVTCPYCNNSFKVNPDDPILYSKGRFDLVKSNQSHPEEFFFGRNFDSAFKTTEKSKSIISHQKEQKKLQKIQIIVFRYNYYLHK